MKIGFYGDSFCCETNNVHNLLGNYDTFITKIKKHYKADLTNLGIGGSSYWDVILKQFNLENIPDVCIFFWTSYHRIYHPKVRNLTYGTVRNIRVKDLKLSNLINYKIYKAADQFYQNLYDDHKAREEMISSLYRFDREILSNLSETKIIHAWCFEQTYQWSNGKVLPFILNDIVGDGSKLAPNHLDGNERNELLASSLINIIDAK